MELVKQIESQAEREIASILEAARAQAAQLLEEERAQIEAWSKEAHERARHEQARRRQTVLSRARAQAQALCAQAQEEVVQACFARVREEIARLRQDETRYRALLEGLLEETRAQIPGAGEGEIHLWADAQDVPLLRSLLRPQEKLQGELEMLGGFLAASADGKVRLDQRLETRLENLKHQRRARLRALLFEGIAEAESEAEAEAKAEAEAVEVEVETASRHEP